MGSLTAKMRHIGTILYNLSVFMYPIPPIGEALHMFFPLLQKDIDLMNLSIIGTSTK